MATGRNSTSRQGLDTIWDKKGGWCQSQTEREMWEIVVIKENIKVKGHKSTFLSLYHNGTWKLQSLLENTNETRWQSASKYFTSSLSLTRDDCNIVQHWLLCYLMWQRFVRCTGIYKWFQICYWFPIFFQFSGPERALIIDLINYIINFFPYRIAASFNNRTICKTVMEALFQKMKEISFVSINTRGLSKQVYVLPKCPLKKLKNASLKSFVLVSKLTYVSDVLFTWLSQFSVYFS